MNLNEWRVKYSSLFTSIPISSNNMYYKKNNYVYKSGGNTAVIPADAPSGMYEIRVSTKPMLMEGLASIFFFGVLDPNEGSSSTSRFFKPEYEPWFSSTAQPLGVDYGEPEGEDLQLVCNVLNGVVSGGDIGFVGYARHLSGSETVVCTLPQPTTPPAVSETVLGSYCFRQLTE